MKSPDDPSTPQPPSAAARAVGSALAGQRIEAVLHAGPVFTVYRVVDALGIERVALKEYCPQALCERDAEGAPHLRDPEDAAAHAAFEAGRAAFVEEMRQLARLRLPGLVRVRDLIEADGSLCALMPLLPGVPLDQLPASQNDEALHALLLSLLEPLAQLHAAGLVHGAVHARQLLWSPGRVPVLLGFGAAAQALGLAPAPDDRAPELRAPSAESTLGPWTDVYALAAMVLRQLSGRPWDDEAAAGEGVAVLLERALGPAQDAGKRQVLVKALQASLAPEPAQRPHHAGELRELLVAAGTSRPARPARPQPGDAGPAVGRAAPSQGSAPRGEPERTVPAMRADGGFVMPVVPRRRDDSRRNVWMVLLLATSCVASGWWVRGLWTQEQERQRVDRLLVSAATQVRDGEPDWNADGTGVSPSGTPLARSGAETPPGLRPPADHRPPERATELRGSGAPDLAGVAAAPAAVTPLPRAEVSSTGAGPANAAAAASPAPPAVATASVTPRAVPVTATRTPVEAQAALVPPAAPVPAPAAPVAAVTPATPVAARVAPSSVQSPSNPTGGGERTARVAASNPAPTPRAVAQGPSRPSAQAAERPSQAERAPRRVEASAGRAARAPSRSVAAAVPAVAPAAAPRAACGTQTKYALLQCMQRQCRQPEQRGHLQCQRLLRDNVISS